MPFFENDRGSVPLMMSDAITTTHGFTTRLGGVSCGIWASLNLGENRGDDSSCVERNYDLLCASLHIPRERLVFSRQVHRTDVRVVSADDAHRLFTTVPYEADALITTEPNLPLIVFTADCIPILLHDPVRKAIGAVHAGWRGTTADIVGAAVGRMCSEFDCRSENIHAAIGPGISVCCFETDREVPDAAYSVLGDDAAPFVTPRGEKFMVDLKGINRALLLRAGLMPQNIDISDECTMCLHDKYWSHRYTRGERGAQGAVIMLEECSN